MKTYLIIDKFNTSRESLCAMIHKIQSNSIVYHTSTVSGAENIIQEKGHVDYLLLNPAYPKFDGNEYMRQLKRLNPGAKILVFSYSRNYHHVQALIESGADIIIDINSTKGEICAAIKSLVSGYSFRNESFGSHDALQTDFQVNSTVNQSRHGYDASGDIRLTNRQREVLDYVTKGYANKLIAYELGVTEGTVKLHVSSILRALDVTNRTEAAMRAGQLLESAAH